MVHIEVSDSKLKMQRKSQKFEVLNAEKRFGCKPWLKLRIF